MTAVQMQLNAELFGALQVISGDEALMKKLLSRLSVLLLRRKTKTKM